MARLNFLDDRLKESSCMPDDILTQLSRAKWQPLGRYRSALSSGGGAKPAASAADAISPTAEALIDEFDDAASDSSMGEFPRAG